MNTRASAAGARPPARFAHICMLLCAALITGCASRPEVIIANESPVTIKADVQMPVTTTINGFPMPGKRTQTIIVPGASGRAASGVDVEPRKVWLRVVSIVISDASLLSPALDPVEFSVAGTVKKIILTVTTEGREVRIVAVDDTGATMSLLSWPPESPRPPDTRQPVFDSIGMPAGDIR